MARFFVPIQNLSDARGRLEGQELAHLRKVLRLGPGDRITLFDESGREHEAIIRRVTDEQGEFEIVESREARAESGLEITLGAALTKGEKMDFVVEKATELGVQKIAPFTSVFSIPRLDGGKIAARTARWRKIALSATKQCGRTRVPEILPVCGFEELARSAPARALKIFFWEEEREQSLRQIHEKHSEARSLLLALGPEGGFAAQEAALARSQGYEAAHLGRRILRAETAALAALTLAQFLWGDLR